MAQSAQDAQACGLQHQVSELEALVCVACARGVEAQRCRDVIEDAVKRARRKGAMLPHLDSSLLLSTLEQAKSEIAGLAEVTATNAQLMQEELLHHQAREEEQRAGAGSEDVASVVSVPASQAPSSVSLPPSQDSSSRGEPLSGAGSGGSGPLAPHTPAAPGSSGGGSLGPADAVAPMRNFASEIAAEAAVEAEEDRFFRHSLSMRASKSGDFKTAASYDFEAAVSPRAAYHVRDAPFRLSGDAQDSGFGRASREAEERGAAGEEGEEEVPVLVYSRNPAFAPGRRQGRVAEEGGEEQPEEEEEEEEEEEGGTREPSLSPWIRQGSGGGSGEGRCWAGMPPGFNPSACVEGSAEEDAFSSSPIDPSSPTGVGAVDLISYSSAPFSLHTVTPPRHVMQELAAGVRSMRM